MNADAPMAMGAPAHLRRDGCTAAAGWFGPEGRAHFGWLYRPERPAANRVGIVIVPPFGREEICAHRTLRHLAEDAARAGSVAVRFDLDGTGDSAGDDTDPDRIGAWLASIDAACNLARGAGATQLVLAGVRLGATLATLAAPRRGDIAALVAFNAVVSGKAYLRELRAFQLAMNLQPAPDGRTEPGQETSGFILADATCAMLKTINLARADAAPAALVHVLERDDLPERGDWPARLRTLGAAVTERRIAGYAGMLDDPHRGEVAREFIDACVACAAGLPAVPPGPAPSVSSPALRLRAVTALGGASIVEAPVVAAPGLFAMLAAPASGSAARAVLMLNAGAVRHIGSNRMDVPLSRELAAAGLQVLRADLTGLGDSPARAGADENVVFGPHALEEIGSLVAWLRANGARDVVAGGMCAGAYHAIRAAFAGQAIDATFSINPGVIDRPVQLDPEGASLFVEVGHYNQSIKSGRSWRKLLTGRVAFRTIFRVAAWHAEARGRALWRGFARRVRLPLRYDLARDLRGLATRGARAHFVFSENEPGRTLLATEAGSALPRLRAAGMLSVQVFEGPDHTFTQRWAQSILSDAVKKLVLSGGAPPR